LSLQRALRVTGEHLAVDEIDPIVADARGVVVK
jgi:hypothetical protein